MANSSIQIVAGSDGVGVPVGGTTGQVLAKIDATNYNTQWVNQSGSVTSVNGDTGVVVLDTGDIAESGNLYFTNARAISATLTGYTSGAGTVAATDTILQAIQKLNGNIAAATPTIREVTLTDAATVTPNANTTDIGILTSLSQNTVIANPTGTPTGTQVLRLRIKSSAVRTLTWDTAYRGSTDISLPAETSGSNLTDYMTFWYNTTDSKWDFIGKNFGF
jgi:hypothetical protein